MPWQTDRPRPVPAPTGLVVKNGSKMRARVAASMPAPVSVTDSKNARVDGSVRVAIVTCPPNGLMRPIHDRMPVILDPAAESDWLDPDRAPGELLELLVPAPDDALVTREVSDLVNNVREDGPALIGHREEQSALF